MKEFVDAEGRPWRLALTCASAARIRDNVAVPGEDGKPKPFDLVDARQVGEAIGMMRASPVLLAEVLYAAMMPDVHARPLTRDEFLGGMRGDAIDAGREAMEAEIVSFSPGRLRGVVSSMLATMDDLQDAETAKIKTAIEQMRTAGLGTSSTSAPAFSESTPASGLSVNSSTPAAAG